MSTFTGFSEEDLIRIKSGETKSDNDSTLTQKPSRTILSSTRKKVYQYKSINKQDQKIDDAIDNLQFDKCRLSIKPTSLNDKTVTAEDSTKGKHENSKSELNEEIQNVIIIDYDKENKVHNNGEIENVNNGKNTEVDTSPEIVRGMDYIEDDMATHRAKLEELQLQQKLMEEQNKKRKEMLSKALADRTRQTEEEVMKLEKIKKELQVLDGQFSQDVGVLRKKIDLACLTYSEAEKHYLKAEKEFLQAKIQLQKEREKKELLTEHLCALITHNETRKAQKLETLMLELATNKTNNLELATNKTNNLELTTNKTNNLELASNMAEPKVMDEKGDSSVIVDGVDQRTGKMVEFNGDS